MIDDGSECDTSTTFFWIARSSNEGTALDVPFMDVSVPDTAAAAETGFDRGKRPKWFRGNGLTCLSLSTSIEEEAEEGCGKNSRAAEPVSSLGRGLSNDRMDMDSNPLRNTSNLDALPACFLP